MAQREINGITYSLVEMGGVLCMARGDDKTVETFAIQTDMLFDMMSDEGIRFHNHENGGNNDE